MSGNAIKYFRELRGISQDKLAETINIPRPMLSYIETDRVRPTVELFRKIAEALNCYVWELDKETIQKKIKLNY